MPSAALLPAVWYTGKETPGQGPGHVQTGAQEWPQKYLGC